MLRRGLEREREVEGQSRKGSPKWTWYRQMEDEYVNVGLSFVNWC